MNNQTTMSSTLNDLVSSLALLQYTAYESPDVIINQAKRKAVHILEIPDDDWFTLADGVLPSGKELIAIKTVTGKIRIIRADTLRQYCMGATKVATAWIPLPT